MLPQQCTKPWLLSISWIPNVHCCFISFYYYFWISFKLYVGIFLFRTLPSFITFFLFFTINTAWIVPCLEYSWIMKIFVCKIYLAQSLLWQLLLCDCCYRVAIFFLFLIVIFWNRSCASRYCTKDCLQEAITYCI